MRVTILPPDTEHFTCVRILEMPHPLAYNLDPKEDPQEPPRPLKVLSPETVFRDMVCHRHVYLWWRFRSEVMPLFTPLELESMKKIAKMKRVPTRPICFWKLKHLLTKKDAFASCPNQDKNVPWQYLQEFMFGRVDEEGNKIIPQSPAGAILVMGGSKQQLIQGNIKSEGHFSSLVHVGFYASSSRMQWHLKVPGESTDDFCDMETLFLTGK